jgi:N6-L-threonylcarbamoyladenine synthase
MKVLGIETSCDETSAAVVEDGKVLSNVIFSQVAAHAAYHGVVPELASRMHLQKIGGVIEEALKPLAGAKPDAVAYTRGPGLMGPLLVGKVAAQTLASLWNVPLLGVNHLEGHIFAVELAMPLRFPLVALIVAGGHTDLVLARAPGRYRVLGRTRDDAAGEAYDKVAKLLELSYPGGPVIDRLAKQGDAAAVNFPRPHMPDSWDFSFAGIKTSVLYHVRGRALTDKDKADICASFQEAMADTLVAKALRAAKRFKVREIVIGGGVAANSRLRALLAERAAAAGVNVSMPPPILCTDNGAMIAHVAWHRLKAGRLPRLKRSDPSLPFENWAR